MHHLQFFTFRLSWWIPNRGKPQIYTFTLLISRFLISSFHPPQWTTGCRKTLFTLEFFGSFSTPAFRRRISRCKKNNIVPCFHFSFLISSFWIPQENSKVRTHLSQMHSNSITRLLRRWITHSQMHIKTQPNQPTVGFIRLLRQWKERTAKLVLSHI